MAIDGTFETESREVARLATILSRCIVPVFRTYHKRPQHCGSGFLVSRGTRSFLVSAAHVFEETKRGGDLFFYIESKITRKVAGKIYLARGFDVGVLELEEPRPPYPRVDKYSLPVGAFMVGALPRERKQYLIVGFPASKSKANPAKKLLMSMPYIIRGNSICSGKYVDIGLAPETHIIISFDRGKEKVLDPDGKNHAFPEPIGMSGCPVFLLFDESGTIDPNQTPVVGVAIEHRARHHAIIATDIGIVLSLINDAL